MRSFNSAGMSLVGVLIGLVLASGLTLIVGKLISDGTRGGKSAEMRQEVATLMNAVRDTLDCQQTLGITATTPLPVPCPAGPVVLRKKPVVGAGPGPGPEIAPGGKIGDWTVSGRCEGGEILVAATRPGIDPVTKRPWNDMPIATDLFRGASDFCNAYFGTAAPTCPMGTKKLAVDGTYRCVNVEDSCAVMGFAFDAGTGRCVALPAFGGTYEKGEFCETPNTLFPGLGCSCPPGYTDTFVSHTYEGGSDFDEPHLCVRLN